MNYRVIDLQSLMRPLGSCNSVFSIRKAMDTFLLTENVSLFAVGLGILETRASAIHNLKRY